ncbi:unnamed protein product [Closterium sp. NIES-54]
MRGGQKRPSAAGGTARGETAMGTFFILILLAIVGFAATYSVLSALSPPPSILVDDDLLLEASSPSDSEAAATTGAGAKGGSSSTGAGGAGEGASGGGGEDSRDFCLGEEHLELWGDAVKWGSNNPTDTAAACCQQCKDMCTGAVCQCNAWVYCGNKELCKDNYRQCWLKRQEDVLKPEVYGNNPEIPWTSGLVHGAGKSTQKSTPFLQRAWMHPVRLVIVHPVHLVIVHPPCFYATLSSLFRSATLPFPLSPSTRLSCVSSHAWHGTAGHHSIAHRARSHPH